MLIKMKTGIAGLWIARRGQVVDRPFKEALSLIKHGIAEVCAETSKEDIKKMDDINQGVLQLEPEKSQVIQHPESVKQPEMAVEPKSKTKSLLDRVLKKN